MAKSVCRSVAPRFCSVAVAASTRRGTKLRRADIVAACATERVVRDVTTTAAQSLSPEATRSITGHVVASAAGTVSVTFRWPIALNSKHVSVAGSFSAWRPLELYASLDGGDFFRSVKVPIGEHEYKFMVDGEWKIYPSDPVTVDEHGNCNNHLLAYPTVRFVWNGALGGESVYVAGSSSQWTELLPLERDSATNVFSLDCCLPPRRYHYLFLVDGKWKRLATEPHGTDPEGRLCNKISIAPYDAYRIYYATGWERAAVKARLKLQSGESTDWKALKLCDTRSRSGFFGVSWKVATVVVGTFQATEKFSAASAVLEFYVQNANGEEDRPYGGDLYRCPVVGGYKLQDGILKPFSKAVQGPVMLVSDLDGTMVSQDSESDAAMRDFAFYWENNASLYNSILVYNTGRSLGQFTHLLQEKGGSLSLPDIVITAVGTKIFHLSTRGRGRSRASGLDWTEDVNWTSLLDEGWNLQVVREAGHGLISHLHSDRIGWLDYGEEHPHRVAFTVRVDAVDDAKRLFADFLSQRGLEVQLISSGTGGWRYLDCVPVNGGKRAALEYVRQFYNIPLHRCVAAGDSCNDILMLEGKNPAIVVGNAQEELCQWLLSQPQTHRIVFTDAHHGRGIIEGLSRLGLY